MITIKDLRGTEYVAEAVVPRGSLDLDDAVTAIRPLLDDVRQRGAEAVLDAAERFDGIRPEHLRVPQHELDDALASLDPDVRAALELSIDRVRTVHGAQRRTDTTSELGPGAHVTTRWVPVNRVGLYVPGGRSVYPSSVVMNVVPALEAGVPSLAIASPPQKEHRGLPHPTILATAALLEVDEVYAAGGAQAVAMFAYGAADADGHQVCAKVDMVTGPGNIWVTAAKRALRGRIGTDSEAGPTEVLVLADRTANPIWVAADLISQAEHDPMAASVLVTDSVDLALAVAAEVDRLFAETKHQDRVGAALGGQQSAILMVDDQDAAIELANAYGAEHLEIHTADAHATAARITNAGAVFVGGSSPVSLGDYCAGSNHVLPTTGGSAHIGGLSTQTFLRCMYVIDYDADALAEVAKTVTDLATAEDLPAHGDAVRVRSTEP